MSDFILIDSETRMAVPLPFHTQDFRGEPVTIVDFYPRPAPSSGRVVTSEGDTFYPSVCDLEIISEADFMAERSITRTDKEA